MSPVVLLKRLSPSRVLSENIKSESNERTRKSDKPYDEFEEIEKELASYQCSTNNEEGHIGVDFDVPETDDLISKQSSDNTSPVGDIKWQNPELSSPKSHLSKPYMGMHFTPSSASDEAVETSFETEARSETPPLPDLPRTPREQGMHLDGGTLLSEVKSSRHKKLNHKVYPKPTRLPGGKPLVMPGAMSFKVNHMVNGDTEYSEDDENCSITD